MASMTCVVSEEDLLLACIKFRFLSSPLVQSLFRGKNVVTSATALGYNP